MPGPWPLLQTMTHIRFPPTPTFHGSQTPKSLLLPLSIETGARYFLHSPWWIQPKQFSFFFHFKPKFGLIIRGVSPISGQ